jgi:hypothetical protein
MLRILELQIGNSQLSTHIKVANLNWYESTRIHYPPSDGDPPEGAL